MPALFLLHCLHPPMIAVGIDLGGTKIEAQVFGQDWSVVSKTRLDTPKTYPALLDALTDLIAWADGLAGRQIAIGVGAAGQVHPTTGRILAANLCAHGHALPAEFSARIRRPVTHLNDAHAFAISEAIFGAGKGHKTVAGLVLGTGIGGSVIRDGQLTSGVTGLMGEFGHTAASAAVVAKYDLPLVKCGCGRTGCVETLASGPGLQRIAYSLTGEALSTREIAQYRETTCAIVWTAWCALIGDLIRTLNLTVDPDVIVLGGGLSQIDGVRDDIDDAAQTTQIGGFPTPQIVLASGGETSGARGAAFVAWRASQ